jgi:hypothetical protein
MPYGIQVEYIYSTCQDCELKKMQQENYGLFPLRDQQNLIPLVIVCVNLASTLLFRNELIKAHFLCTLALINLAKGLCDIVEAKWLYL